MDECEKCDYLRRYIQDLKGRIEEIESELKDERQKSDDYISIKSERDELRAAANRSYDNWATTPRDMP